MGWLTVLQCLVIIAGAMVLLVLTAWVLKKWNL